MPAMKFAQIHGIIFSCAVVTSLYIAYCHIPLRENDIDKADLLKLLPETIHLYSDLPKWLPHCEKIFLSWRQYWCQCEKII